MIVPFAAGGSTDVAARLVAEHLTRTLGQQVVVENRTGANGVIGIEAAAKSDPDGYTVLIAPDAIASNPHVYKVSYDALKDLTAVIQLSRQPIVLAAHPSLGVSTLGELIARVKQQPGLRYATGSGAGSAQHMVTQWFAQLAGIELEQVPYRGGGQAINDLIAGHVQARHARLDAADTALQGRQAAAAGADHRGALAKPAGRADVPGGGRQGPGARPVARRVRAGRNPGRDHRTAQCRDRQGPGRPGHQGEPRQFRAGPDRRERRGVRAPRARRLREIPAAREGIADQDELRFKQSLTLSYIGGNVEPNLLLVGSIPLDSAEDVLRSFGGALGPSLTTMPDGEVGPRKHWISRIHYQVLATHPDLEIVRRPQPEDGVERLNPRDAADSWQFRVRGGVDRVRFGDPGWRLGYAREAIGSYFVFKTLRQQGVLARHLRFQVSLPSVNSALPPRIFSDPADVAKVRPGFAEALAAEIDTIVAKIPGEDLAIQWDCATEVQDAYGAIPGYAAEGAIARNLEQFRTLSPRVPGHGTARLSFLLRHARRLAALRSGRPLGDGRARQCGGRGLGPPGRLDPHPGARRRR